jgi:RHS repeat-associated protein
MKGILFVVLCVLWSGLLPAQQPTNAWSNQDYDFYAGDFNGDGFTDLLFIAHSPSMPSGILLSDGTAPTIMGQTWASNYLGIPWSSDAYTVLVGDFNGDGKTDVFLQSNGPGDSYLLLTDSSGHISAISQTVADQAMGLAWSADKHHLVVGDFNGDGHADLFFQPTAPGGTSAVVYADANGQFTSIAPAQSWADGYLGFNWSVADANVYAGDFNGDGRADLLIQAQPITDITNGTPSYTYPSNMNGVVLARGAAQPFSMIDVQYWSRYAFGVDWSPLTNHLVIADFNGDGPSDVLFQPLTAGAAARLILGNATGPIFTTAKGALPADVAISGDSAVLVAGTFAGGSASQLLLQAVSSEGRNSIATSIGRGIHPRAIALPTLSITSVSMSGIGYPTQNASSSTITSRTATPMAGTVGPTSAGRTAGQFSVTPTGAATYNMPLWTPPGAREIEPHLALHYMSGGPDGPMGPGWSLTGLSAIVRCGKTWASSGGTPAGVTLATADDICLDGNRLRLTSGTQGVAGSTYQTEIADFSLVTANGTQGNGPQYFIVQGKDGRSYEYGNTADSRIYASGAATPYAWALNKVRDRQSNNMVFTYSGGTVLTLSKIQYTATPGTGNAAPYEVDFNYVARTGGTTIAKYVAGGQVSQANQLDHVTVLASGAIVRKYQLGYAASATTNRPMLQTVQECGGSAGTDCIRPTTINYQTGAAGWSTTATSTGLTGQYGFIPVDLNGDGIPDVLYGKLVSGTTTIHWYARIATTSGYGAEIDTGATTSSAASAPPIITGAFAGNSSVQFLAPISTIWNVYTYASGAFTHASAGVAVSGEQFAIDWDGDGLPDLVALNGPNVTIRRNITTSGGAVSFATNPMSVYTTAGSYIFATAQVDFDGDGKADLLLNSYNPGCMQACGQPSLVALYSNGFSAAPFALTLGGFTVPISSFGDWNGDGCTDIITATTIYVSNCARGFTSIATGISNGSNPIAIDWDGDGMTDMVYTNNANNTLYVARSTGNGIAAGVSTGIPSPSTKTFFPVDQNSDGQQDLAYIDSANSFAVGYYPHNDFNTPPDLASSITDGFGINFSPTYVPISQSNYTKYSDAVFPEEDFQGPMYVVNQFSASDGTGGTYTNDFAYWGARLNLQGRGFEGFYAARQHDSRSGIWVLSYYQRQFPYIGSLFETETFEPDAVTYMGINASTYTYATPGGLSGTSCSSCYFPYISSTAIYNYEVTGSKKGGAYSYISTTTTNYTYDSYGNLTDTRATTTDTDSATPASPFNGQSWFTEIANTITNDNSAANWCLGRPSVSKTTKIAQSQPTLTRTVQHNMDYVQCRATAEIVEPGDSRLQVTTNFGFDACGNTNSVSVIGLDQNGAAMPARTTTTSYGTRCQLPESVTNALNQTTAIAYRYDLGLKASATDPNGITVAWTYDDFGRKIKETRPDSTYTTWSFTDCVSTSCWGTGDLRFQTTETLFNSAGSAVRAHETFADGLDRVRYDEGNRVLGVWNTQITSYDSLGRKQEVQLPYSSASNGYHIYTYDVGNRPITDTLYTSSGTQYRQIQLGYQGQTAFVTDPNGKTITKVTDVAGKLRWVTDPPEGVHGAAAGTTKYTYDSFDNLVTIVDAIGATSQYAYNIRGFKTGSTDADTGSWTFTPDSLNELTSQKDANAQITSFTYDLLGRMLTRLEPESATPTSWVYGNSAALHEIGQLHSVTKPDGYAESYAYDSIGRPQTKIYTEDGTNYQFDYAYNTLGAPDTLTYPTSTSGFRFQFKYLYDSAGYLNEVQDASAGTAFWTLTGANDNSAPTMEVLGNAVSVATGYTPWTNEMVTRTEGSGGSTTNLQNLSYTWDLNGNLSKRVDNRQSLTEGFTLDALNRLSTVTLNNVQTLSVIYDQAGDITNKSDVGAYTYGNAAHPHAVTAAGSWNIGYDLNGNMNSRAGGAIFSYSYNLPSQINYNGSSSQFNYDSSHQRWKQVANYAGTTETIHYIGGLLQIVTRGTNPTEYRHQIPAGSSTAVYTRRSDGTTGTYYATSDHLGSADLVMDSAANVLVRESFSPFGARRGSNWQSIPSTQDYTAIQSTTRQGFTGHEMLDAVGLIHMNGRVYDPTIGRFLSADSVIQSLGATQSINPYSYAWNDPLRYTDPSGHSLLGDIIGIVAAIIAIWFCQPELIPAFLGGAGAAASSITIGTAIFSGFVGGFVGSLISTGSLSAALMGGLIGGLTAGAFYGIGTALQGDSNSVIAERTVAHAAVGCVAAVASSGNCGKGALSAAVSEAANSKVLHGAELAKWGLPGRTALSGLIGGLTSRITGGNFAEGFSIAAAGYLYNTAIHAHPAGRDTILENDDGTEEVRSGGSLSWRNNNPGNMRDTAFAESEGAIGEAHGFAVFPTVDAGTQALGDLLQTNTYQGLTVGQAISRYAPPVENDTANYTNMIGQFTGIDPTTPMSSLNAAQLQSVVSAIRRIEGWATGTVTIRRPQ